MPMLVSSLNCTVGSVEFSVGSSLALMGRTRTNTRMLPLRSRMRLCSFFLSSIAALYLVSISWASSPRLCMAFNACARSVEKVCFADCASDFACRWPSRSFCAARVRSRSCGPNRLFIACNFARRSVTNRSASWARSACRRSSSSCCCSASRSRSAAAMASSCRRFWAASASACALPWASDSFASSSCTRRSRALFFRTASASAWEEPCFAPLEASALARSAPSARSRPERLASSSSKRC
mmetsp:Transcript_49861/g.145006  ORF Transcript_49861/g.145006 Transcript_49861/m.145006 type:complete len:240 (+) Transcript_49861:1175-1894(+)